MLTNKLALQYPFACLNNNLRIKNFDTVSVCYSVIFNQITFSFRAKTTYELIEHFRLLQLAKFYFMQNAVNKTLSYVGYIKFPAFVSMLCLLYYFLQQFINEQCEKQHFS